MIKYGYNQTIYREYIIYIYTHHIHNFDVHNFDDFPIKSLLPENLPVAGGTTETLGTKPGGLSEFRFEPGDFATTKLGNIALHQYIGI